ncbi:MAG: ThiF family adenylyltransferase [Chloroflexi bacterium]|nr:ThiF family adenylyltransferase [Chloroflexota bacterium]
MERGAAVELVVPGPFWARALAMALARPAGAEVRLVLPLGLARCGPTLRLLARRPPLPSLGEAPSQQARLMLLFSDAPAAALQASLPALGGGPGRWRALLVVGRGPAEGRVLARAVSPAGEALPIASLALPGPGLPRLPLLPGDRPAGEDVDREADAVPPRWSRTAGALGEAAWRRLAVLRVGLVGCGRLGSALALALAQAGLRELVLVDPDVVEAHTLGEGAALEPRHLGQPKAEALAASLSEQHPWLHARAVSGSVSRWQALAALRGCEVLLSCADADGGRLGAALLASRYVQVLLDVGTGIFQEQDGRRVRGGEVRLVLPGDGCLGCLGGVADPSAARAQLGDPAAEMALLGTVDWRRQRAGSLRSLNLTVAGLALQLLERLLTGEQDRSTWLRLEWDRGPAPTLTALPPHRQPSACVCQHLGAGDP